MAEPIKLSPRARQVLSLMAEGKLEAAKKVVANLS